MPGDPDLFDQVIPEGANVKLCEELFVPLEEAEHKYVDRENGYCELSSLSSLLPSPCSKLILTLSTSSQLPVCGSPVPRPRTRIKALEDWNE